MLDLVDEVTDVSSMFEGASIEDTLALDGTTWDLGGVILVSKNVRGDEG